MPPNEGYRVGMLVDWYAQVLSEGTRAQGASAANMSETSVHSLKYLFNPSNTISRIILI